MKVKMVLLLALAMAVPSSMAATQWSWYGGVEPDTNNDIVDGYFFWETDTDPSPSVKKVYFNAFIGDSTTLGLATPNPNVGAAGSRIAPIHAMSMTAFVGVWKDCNGDGYLGFGEIGMLHYQSVLLQNTDTCEPGTFFNRDGWVTEFWSIGPQRKAANLTESDFPRIITDGKARVWGDFGVPGDADAIHFDCTHTPWQEGTADSTGGALTTFDCFTGYTIAETVNANDPTGGDLTFDGNGGPYHPDRDCDHPLNVQFDTYGNSPCESEDNVGLLETNTSRPAATVWDCAEYEESWTDLGSEAPDNVTVAAETIELKNDRGAVLSVRNLPNAAPAAGAGLDGSVWDVTNYALATDCNDEFANNAGPGESLVSASFAATNPADGKRMADFNMTAGNFGSGVQGRNPKDVEDQNANIHRVNDNYNATAGTVLGEQEFPGIALPPGVPRTGPTNFALANTRSGVYTSSVGYLPPTWMGPTTRDGDLTRLSSGMYFTFYADLTPSSAYEFPSSGGFYGAEACGSTFGPNGDGVSIRNGWECDPSKWWLDFDIGAEGQNGCHQFQKDDNQTEEDESNLCVPGGYDDDPSPGDNYYIRDIDCYDGSLTNVDGANGVGLGLTLLEEEDGPCPTVVFPE